MTNIEVDKAQAGHCPMCGLPVLDGVIHHCMAEELPIVSATLRDQFAMAALNALVQTLTTEEFNDLFYGIKGGAREAKIAYVYADKMMAARE